MKTLCTDHFNSNLEIKTHIILARQKQQVDYVGFQETFDTPPLKPSKTWAQFQKAQLTPYKIRFAFFDSPLGQGVMLMNLLPVTTPRIEPRHTHSC